MHGKPYEVVWSEELYQTSNGPIMIYRVFKGIVRVVRCILSQLSKRSEIWDCVNHERILYIDYKSIKVNTTIYREHYAQPLRSPKGPTGPALAPRDSLGKTKVWDPMHYMLPIYIACP